MPLAGTLSIQPFEVSLLAVMGFESGAFCDWLIPRRPEETGKKKRAGKNQ